jgi:hypothetical protein
MSFKSGGIKARISEILGKDLLNSLSRSLAIMASRPTKGVK